ncbi:MAG: hypothetical protein H7Y22_16530 [Gemmatimonadaceae bacterium]|nr:hypothetical protein [Gloeobacterales cyanobacterium ES-bin-141]
MSPRKICKVLLLFCLCLLPLPSIVYTQRVEAAPPPLRVEQGIESVVLNGQDHDYERFALQDPAEKADLVQGVRQLVVGRE